MSTKSDVKVEETVVEAPADIEEERWAGFSPKRRAAMERSGDRPPTAQEIESRRARLVELVPGLAHVDESGILRLPDEKPPAPVPAELQKALESARSAVAALDAELATHNAAVTAAGSAGDGEEILRLRRRRDEIPVLRFAADVRLKRLELGVIEYELSVAQKAAVPYRLERDAAVELEEAVRTWANAAIGACSAREATVQGLEGALRVRRDRLSGLLAEADVAVGRSA